LPYSVTKAAQLHLMRCLATTQGPKVRVNAVLPGFLRTEWVSCPLFFFFFFFFFHSMWQVGITQEHPVANWCAGEKKGIKYPADAIKMMQEKSSLGKDVSLSLDFPM